MHLLSGASQVVLVVRKLPASEGDIRDTVQSLAREDPLEEGMGTHFSILAWRIPWTQELGNICESGRLTDSSGKKLDDAQSLSQISWCGAPFQGCMHDPQACMIPSQSGSDPKHHWYARWSSISQQLRL